MGRGMTLIDAIRVLYSLPEEETIYAKPPWVDGSLVIVAPEPPSGGVPTEAGQLGLTYFLEVGIARDFIDGWRSNLGAKPTLQQTCSRLIQYAVTDA